MEMNENKTIRYDEIRITISDTHGKSFSKDWKATADRRDAIRWTLENVDLPYIIDILEISSIEVKEGKYNDND